MLNSQKNLSVIKYKIRPRGQGLVETVILFPILLVVFSGMVEFGFMLQAYLALQDAARNAARFASDGLFYLRDRNTDCKTTQDFYRQAACLVNQELSQEQPEIEINTGDGNDDIIISAFGIEQGKGIVARYPDEFGERGWSAAWDGNGKPNQVSRLTSTNLGTKINSSAPSTGLVAVEIFHAYQQKLNLPWITAFLDDPLILHNYAVMPLVSAEPDPVP